MSSWDARFLTLASHIAQWSKDPSTQVGAVIADPLHRVMGVGYNGFPRGIQDHPERYEDRQVKLQLIVHAEMNALLNAAKTEGCTLYTYPLPPCVHCATQIIQAGITRIVSPVIAHDSKWYGSCRQAEDLFREAGIKLD